MSQNEPKPVSDEELDAWLRATAEESLEMDIWAEAEELALEKGGDTVEWLLKLAEERGYTFQEGRIKFSEEAISNFQQQRLKQWIEGWGSLEKVKQQMPVWYWEDMQLAKERAELTRDLEDAERLLEETEFEPAEITSEDRERLHEEIEPKPSGITAVTASIVKFLTTACSIPLLPLIPITTASLGCLVAIPPIGLAYVAIMTLIWMPLSGLLIGMSRLWERVPLLQPLLAFVGIPLALIGNIFISLTPNPDRQDKMIKLAICDSFPLSHQVIKAENYRCVPK